MQEQAKRKSILPLNLFRMTRVLKFSSLTCLLRRSVCIAQPALLSMLLCLPLAANAQSDSSSLSGTVTDPSGAVVPNARVTAHNDSNGQDRVVQTNGSGSYTITNLSPGNYTVKVEAKGFGTVVQKGTHLDPNIGSRYDAALVVGESSTTVEVEADANTLQTESAAVGQLVTSEQVKSIQLNGRNPIYLSQLEPGVARNAPLSSFNFSPDFTGPYINGARSNESMLSLDGAPMIRTRANGTTIGVGDIDSWHIGWRDHSGPEERYQ
jgi:hypothetical protein